MHSKYFPHSHTCKRTNLSILYFRNPAIKKMAIQPYVVYVFFVVYFLLAPIHSCIASSYLVSVAQIEMVFRQSLMHAKKIPNLLFLFLSHSYVVMENVQFEEYNMFHIEVGYVSWVCVHFFSLPECNSYFSLLFYRRLRDLFR